MARRCYDEMQMTATIASVHSDACRDPVEDIRNDAFNEYQRVKKHKQNELNIRRLNSSNPLAAASAVKLTKQQKKKDDNHASAVASRSKQEYLLKKFEEVLLKKIADTNLLSMGYTESQAKINYLKKIIEQRDHTIAVLNDELSIYRNANTGPEPAVANGNGNGNTTAATSFSDHSHAHHPHHAVDLVATMDEIMSTEVPPFDPTAHKLAEHAHHPHLVLVSQHWSTRSPEEFGMSNNLNPAA